MWLVGARFEGDSTWSLVVPSQRETMKREAMREVTVPRRRRSGRVGARTSQYLGRSDDGVVVGGRRHCMYPFGGGGGMGGWCWDASNLVCFRNEEQQWFL